MKMPKLVVGYLLDDEVFVKSFTIPESHEWIKWLDNKELAQFFGELFELMIRISEEKEDSETLRAFLEYWHEIAAEWRELALGDTDQAIFEEANEIVGNIVTDWNEAVLKGNEAVLKGQDPQTLLASLGGLIGRALIDSDPNVLGDIAEAAEEELDAPWIDILEVQRAPGSTTRKIPAEREPVADVPKQQREAYLAQPILELELSTRAYNSLTNENIKTVQDLVAKGEWELLEYQNFGERSLLEVQNRLAVRGLYLGMDEDDEDDEEEF